MRLTFIFGTRPEVIKLAPVILEARKRKIETRVILSGQHRHMALPLLCGFSGSNLTSTSTSWCPIRP